MTSDGFHAMLADAEARSVHRAAPGGYAVTR